MERVSLFYDTFIRDVGIEFEVFHDWVDTKHLKVYRDLVIHISFDNGGVAVTPVHLQYAFTEQQKLKSLRAWWNPTHLCMWLLLLGSPFL